MLTSRRIQIFKCIVDDFISTAEPVGSKTLMNKYDLPYSSATIRNDMMILEELGYLEKTHTSSGRVPSIEGYRFYCENLQKNSIENCVEYEIQRVFDSSYNLDEVIKESCDVLANMANLTTVALGPDAKSQTLEHVKIFKIDNHNGVCVFITNTGHTENKNFKFKDLSIQDIQNCCDIFNDRLKGTKLDEIVEKMESIRPLLQEKILGYEMMYNAFLNAFVKYAKDSIYFSGQSNILYQPEFADINKLKRFMNLFEEMDNFREIENISTNLALNTVKGTKLLWLNDVAVVSSSFKVNDEEGKLMVVGPSRMDYEKVITMLEFVVNNIENVYRRNK